MLTNDQFDENQLLTESRRIYYLKIYSNFLFRYFQSLPGIEEDKMEKPHLEKLPQIAFQSIGLSGFTSCNKYHLDGKFCRFSTKICSE